jgi:hypothetical protein
MGDTVDGNGKRAKDILRNRLAAFEKADRSAPKRSAAGVMTELGVTGLKQYRGQIDEEFLRQLWGDKALTTYQEMLFNNPTVRSIMFAVTMLARGVPWEVEPGGEENTDQEGADFLTECKDDMSHTWEDHIVEALTMIPYGFSYHEQVYRFRQGPDALRPGTGSRYNDGKIAWRKWPIRAQITRKRWEMDKQGGIAGMWQQPPYGGDQRSEIFLPIEKCLLYRPERHKNNPEGFSALRSAYRPWHFLTRLEEFEMIGYERRLAGLPVAMIPGGIIKEKGADYNAWDKGMRNVRVNAQGSLIFPSDLWEGTSERMYDVQLLHSGGERPTDVNIALERYDRAIARTMLCDFLFLGEKAVGSYALASSRTTLFAVALGAWLDEIESTINRHAVPRLLALNGFALDKVPQFRHGDIEIPDVKELADAVSKFAAAGMPMFPNPRTENYFLHLLGAPEMTDEEIDEREIEDIEEAEREKKRQETREAAALEMQRARGEILAQTQGAET